MPKPVKYRILLGKLKRASCLGPFFGGKHPYFLCGKLKIIIPNPHGTDEIGSKTIKRIIDDLGISVKEFNNL